ncbi:MAG: hypothetical protein FWG98_11030 [Candidatus Cloacimonetes bacterium]|nr:hypothetical protein [Candidatus Cloacimonadota bacterium]
MTTSEQNTGFGIPARRLIEANLRDFVKKGLFSIKLSLSSILHYTTPITKQILPPPPPPPLPHSPPLIA